jgi:hypothetical protein
VPTGGPLPIIAHDCPDFDLLQKWATGAPPPRISIRKAVAKSARKVPGTTRHRRPVFVGGVAALVSEYRAPVAPVLSVGTTTEKGAEGLTPRSAVCHVSAATHRKVRANSCKFVHGTPLALSKTRLGRAHHARVVRGVVRRLGGGARQNAGATGRADFSKGNPRKGGAGLGLRRVCGLSATPKLSRHVAQCRAALSGCLRVTCRHAHHNAPNVPGEWCGARGIAAHVDSCVPLAPRR